MLKFILHDLKNQIVYKNYRLHTKPGRLCTKEDVKCNFFRASELFNARIV